MEVAKTKSFTVTVSDKAYGQIVELCSLYDCSKSRLFSDLVGAEYARIMGDERALQALQLLQEFRERLAAISDGDSDSDSDSE